MTQPIGVLVMAYGGPQTLDEIPGYLADVRRGRSTSKAIVSEIERNYKSIGGKSPLLEHTSVQASAVRRVLGTHGKRSQYSVHLGMRHWAPWIEETVGRMLDSGIERAISLTLAPQFSSMSVAAYQARIDSGLLAYRGEIDFAHIDSYHDESALIDAFARRVREGIARWPEESRKNVHVVFSAHSLPTRVVESGDPYDAQVRETARLVADHAGLRDSQWSWSYQSAGRTPEPWLGPTFPEHLASLAENGIRNVVSVPVGFVSDHVELLYDIDIEGQKIAREIGIRLERPAALNDDPQFIELLARLIDQKAAEMDWLS